MQSFICPQCGQLSAFDPRVESALCPQCGFTPPVDERKGRYLDEMQQRRYRPFLTELLAHWAGSHTPDPSFSLPTPEEMAEFFWAYRWALGQDLSPEPGREQILAFAAGYLHLRRGESEQAAQHFHLLASLAPRFADAWVWLTATTGDPAVRQNYLETALQVEPDHPLARSVLAMARSEALFPGVKTEERATPARCTQCGGPLPYEPGAEEVECPYCGTQIGLEPPGLPGAEAAPLSRRPLERRYPRQAWADVQRLVRCGACGAEWAMAHDLPGRCVFCGSVNLLEEGIEPVLERPDGLLPFQLDGRQAREAIHALQRPGLQGLRIWWAAWASQELGCRYFPMRLGGTLRNLKLWWAARGFQVTSIVAAYLPFWVFDGVVEVCGPLGDGAVLPEGAQDRQFEDNLFPAVNTWLASALERLYPFALEAWEAYEPRLLADRLLRIPSLDVETVADRARALLLGLARLQAQVQSKVAANKGPAPAGLTIPGQPPLFQVRRLTYRLGLLPIWLALLERRGRYLLGLVNGQTGKVTLVSAAPL